ncbi:hypothetical protein K490DRAFT_31498 [Saccharata proteae CBS 121410]|uniref:Uncharacterized protein n=1 Tax=Saccharata proteae CBS 121410 TaxID=1314787 RepID=A0A9P4M3D9_9PEZI|nr:hypothetical protein K490DRAFT_31498 [Saccharata proteae CBS 121410]
MASSVHWRSVHSRDSSMTSRSTNSDSDESYRAQRTMPTMASPRPGMAQYETCYGRVEGRSTDNYGSRYYGAKESTVSVDTYASTSDEEEEHEEDDDDCPPYEVPACRYETYPTEAIAATPRDFADLFPSTQRLSIRHDDATLDGNMNLRVDTEVDTRHGKQLLTLFHLRMHDLKSRDFSLRRYCRESGREVCHSIRKYHKPPSERPALQRSFSSALAAFRHIPERKESVVSNLRRQDSGYGSIQGEADNIRPRSARSKRAHLIPTNTIKLEFSNYAHVDVKRRGAKSHKKYEFEYWGANYAWKRVTRKQGAFKETSFHLVRSDSDQALAHIVPVPLTTTQAREEVAKGGWIPPCSMWISDHSLINGIADISDIVVASGLMALVDESIKSRFHSNESTQLHIPLSRNASFKMNMDYVGPKRLIDEVFHRTTRGSTSPRGPTPLRRTSVEA